MFRCKAAGCGRMSIFHAEDRSGCEMAPVEFVMRPLVGDPMPIQKGLF